MTFIKIDLLNKPCKRCADGFYTETSIWDDLEGTLHCDECGHKVNRWQTNK